MSIINNDKSTQIERVIFIQSLIFCSNESNSYDAQCQFIEQFISPITTFFSTPDFQNALQNIHTFIKYFGLGEEASVDPNNPSLQIRRQLFYYVNVMHSILKSVRNTEESTMESIEIQNLTNSGFLDMKTNRLKNPAFASYLKILEPILGIIKSLNILHSSELKSMVKTEYLEMTDSAKIMVLGKRSFNINLYIKTELKFL